MAGIGEGGGGDGGDGGGGGGCGRDVSPMLFSHGRVVKHAKSAAACAKATKFAAKEERDDAQGLQPVKEEQLTRHEKEEGDAADVVGRTAKGLRHFAWEVADEVRRRGTTTYNEVADELVTRLAENNPFEDDVKSGSEGESEGEDGLCKTKVKKPAHKKAKSGGTVKKTRMSAASTTTTERNVRRRVYDCINVLVAVGVFGKRKKCISWEGLAPLHKLCALVADKKRITIAAAATAAQNEVDAPDGRVAKKKRKLMPHASKKEGFDAATMAEMDAAAGCCNAEQEEILKRKAGLEEREEILMGLEARLETARALSARNAALGRMPEEAEGLLRVPLAAVVIANAGEDEGPRVEIEMDEAREQVHFVMDAPFALHNERALLEMLDTVSSSPQLQQQEAQDYQQLHPQQHHLQHEPQSLNRTQRTEEADTEEATFHGTNALADCAANAQQNKFQTRQLQHFEASCDRTSAIDNAALEAEIVDERSVLDAAELFMREQHAHVHTEPSRSAEAAAASDFEDAAGGDEQQRSSKDSQSAPHAEHFLAIAPALLPTMTSPTITVSTVVADGAVAAADTASVTRAPPR